MKSRLWVVLFLLGASAAAQLDAARMIRRVRVRVSSENGICEMSAHVRLMGLGGPVAEGTTNDQCEVEFFNLPEGNYHLTVLGDGGAHAESGEINFVSGGPDELEVRVTRPNDSNRNDGVSNDGVPGNSLVSAADLSIPSRARKDLDKATELIGKIGRAHV